MVDGSSLIGDPEKTLLISNEFHRKKLRLAIRSLDENQVIHHRTLIVFNQLIIKGIFFESQKISFRHLMTWIQPGSVVG